MRANARTLTSEFTKNVCALNCIFTIVNSITDELEKPERVAGFEVAADCKTLQEYEVLE